MSTLPPATEQERITDLIKNADLSVDGWTEEIINGCTDRYAAGWLDANVSRLNGNWDERDEDYRDELLEVCRYNIWNDQKNTS